MNDEIIQEKKRLRSEIRCAGRSLNESYIAYSNEGIYKNISALPEFVNSKVLFTYYSVGAEPDTHKIIGLALEMGKTVALPRCYGNGIMDAAEIKNISEMQMGAYNIPAPPPNAKIISPSEIDFAIIPALAFDKMGYRLGQGGGYYDRFLEPSDFFSVGIVRSAFLLEKVPAEHHDARLLCIVTEKEIARLD